MAKLMIVAHPDDETLWGGAHLKSRDWYVVCVTNGDNEIRSSEFKKVLAQSHNLGEILSYPDLINGEKDNWSSCEEQLLTELYSIIDKGWDQIVTHNSEGETGHIHHLKLHSYVTEICKRKGLLDRLFYFGKFYKTEEIPKDLPRLSEAQLSFKKKLVSIYKNERNPIKLLWSHMIPFENWIKA